MLGKAPPIDDAKFQSWIKNFFWRATEELAEAMEVFPDMRHDNYLADNWEKDATLRHFYEEIADAVHFVVEVSIVSGIDPQCVDEMFRRELMLQAEDLGKGVIQDSVETLIFKVMVAMGLAANCLKNKPWKTTQMQTDHAKFKQKMTIVWSTLLELLVWLNLDANALYSLYAKKSNVNSFRIASNY